MKLLRGLVMFFCTVLFAAFGCLLISLALELVTQEEIVIAFDVMQTVPNIQIYQGAAGGILIVLSFLLLRLTVGKIQKEKTIAFDNPDGQVTIALTAIEDLIKKVARDIPEIKELKPTVVATKRGVIILNRLVLYSNNNIPNVTERIQAAIKTNVQDMLGIEEAITVKVHINKIVHKHEKSEKIIEEQEPEPTIPYRGPEYGTGE